MRLDRGFTLVELSIVLVIIGLIAGGIIIGRELIRTAEMRAQVSQVEEIQTAVRTFRNKYNCIPGDCATATNFFSGVTNGNGNSVICNRTNPATGFSCDTAGTNVTMQWANVTTMELSSVFDHLAASKLVNLDQYDETSNASNKPGVGYPAMKFQGSGTSGASAYGYGTAGSVGGVVINHMTNYLYISKGHKLALGACEYSSSLMLYFCGMKPEEAYQFDTKVDDGLPLSGKVTISSHRYVFRVPGDVTNETGCTGSNSVSVNEFNMVNANRNDRSCNPMIDLQF